MKDTRTLSRRVQIRENADLPVIFSHANGYYGWDVPNKHREAEERVNAALNIPQERELRRLIDFERRTCSVDGELVYRCALPYRPDDELQSELIDHGMLATHPDQRRGTIVVITTDGYSYFMEKARAEQERQRAHRREMRLVVAGVIAGALCVVAGFLLGRFL